MLKQTAAMCGAILIFLLCAFVCSAQVLERWFDIAISVNETIFTPSRPAKVDVEFKTEYINALRPKTYPHFLQLRLSKSSADTSKCEPVDCFSDSVLLSQDVQENERFKFEVDLTNLNPQFSSQKPENLLQKVPSGEYFLSAVFYVENKHQIGEVPKFTVIKSNAVKVIIKGMKKPNARIEITYFSGQAPMQAEGVIDGREFYFRARGNHWDFSVAKASGLTNWAGNSKEAAFFVEEDYGSKPFAASHIPQEKAAKIITGFVLRYMAQLGYTNLEIYKNELENRLAQMIKENNGG